MQKKKKKEAKSNNCHKFIQHLVWTAALKQASPKNILNTWHFPQCEAPKTKSEMKIEADL